MRAQEKQEVDRQVRAMLGRSPGFRQLPAREQARILQNTAAVAGTIVENAMAQRGPARRLADPYAVPLDVTPLTPPTFPGQAPSGPGAAQTPFTGGAQPGSASEAFGPKNIGDFGTGIATGVSQAGALLRQVNFPAFVAELVQGVFQAVVDASIQQMQAYGELVQGVTMSLNDFRDANVSENQARDHLVGKFPNLMQINITDAGPRVGLRPDADVDDAEAIGQSLGVQDLGDLDDETIEETLVPAARNDLARSRQALLATTLLMGINRIVVTDGKINAKMKFSFSARDSMQQHAQAYDYGNFGTTTTSQSEWDTGHEGGEGDYSREYTSSGKLAKTSGTTGSSSRWSRGQYQYASTPAIYLTNVTDTVTAAELDAQAKLSGEVSLNFKSETFDLNQLASADEVFRLERVRSAGRGAPGAPVGSPQAAGQPADTTSQNGSAAAPV
jgi:hypothetical protein